MHFFTAQQNLSGRFPERFSLSETKGMAREFHLVSLSKRLIPRMHYYPSLHAGIRSVRGKRTISGSLRSNHAHKAPFPAAASLPILCWMHSTPSAMDAHNPFSDGGKAGNAIAQPEVRVPGPRGAGRLSCFPELLSHQHQGSALTDVRQHPREVSSCGHKTARAGQSPAPSSDRADEPHSPPCPSLPFPSC